MVDKSEYKLKDKFKDEFLTIGQVAKMLKVCNRTIYNLVSEKRIPSKLYARKIGQSWKIRMEDILRFFNEEKK